jgi:hypothetical protein
VIITILVAMGVDMEQEFKKSFARFSRASARTDVRIDAAFATNSAFH